MKLALPVIGAALAFANGAFAHYRFTKLILDGSPTADYQYVRQNTNHNSPVTDVTSDDIRCNEGGLESGSSTEVATVAAGATVGFALDQAIYHAGPLQIYMSKATGDVKSYDGSGDWFKISEVEAKIDASSISWPDENTSEYTFEIPASTPAGQYLLRAEQIGLHGASAPGGAQFYISCAQIEVTGSGSGTPGPTVKLPGAYDPSDPGLAINIYYPIPTSYKAPGPEVWTG
ncbi:hypothetical protein FQN54_002234 [Arachnomyces sp. PD_36]|nr:hypothetical protein FQN54_002234 [Arachnomyces sp. PD_36]